MTRIWPNPPQTKTLHVVGDIQGIDLPAYAFRGPMMQADLTRSTVPDVAHRVQVGDFIYTSTDDKFAPAVAFMDGLGAGDWYSIVGNHDEDGREPEAAAALMGMPGINFTVDLGYAVLVCMYVRAWGTTADAAPDVTWLTGELVAHAERPVIVAAHPPFRDSIDHNAPEMLAVDDAALKAAFDAHPNVKAYLCGHSHTPVTGELVKMIDVGSREVLQVNAGALLLTAPNDDQNRWDRLCSIYLTVEDDRLEVRFRDHGAHQWVGGGLDQQRVHTIPL